MQTIKLRISDKVYDKFLWLLSKFNKDEVEIVTDIDAFSETQQYLDNELNEILKGKASFDSLEEFDRKLEDSISANEAKI